MKLRKIILRTIQFFLLVIFIAIGVLYLTGNSYAITAFRLTYLKGYTTTNIDDHTDFKNSIVLKNTTPQPWALHEKYNQIPLTDTLRHELEKFNSIGFVVIKNGKLLVEEYWDGYSEKSLTNSFSVTKSAVTMLLGKAIEQGYIKSLNQPITDFITEFKADTLAQKCTVGDLSAMTSGLDWTEEYTSPFNPTTEAYFGKNIEDLMLRQKFTSEPGGHFLYLSGDTQLLAIVLQRAVGISISRYFMEEFWQPLGMEQNALWSKDSEGGMEKAFCCLHSNAKDLAKLGQLLLQEGNWNGKQILDSAFVKKMITPNYKAFDENEPKLYGYSIWIDEEHSPNFYGMMGHLGQRVIVVPEENLVIVRLGKEKDERKLNKGHLNTDVYYFVDEVIKMIQENNL